ncbi:TraB/GumN family protein [Jiella pelagia]|uniref:TraB/GumN family protein n=1 Tax=Jiella pelagia TaxID=2986949 RepID=A0ABY7C5T2_9HYPH|nr:TraB/GumN family protein [Jiella pelagia]WAP70581.1 TraB/GumN family protein [Jiella pelagia]
MIGRLRTMAGGAKTVRAALLVALAGLLAPAEGLAASPACEGENLVPGLVAAGQYKAVEAKAAKVENGEGRFFEIAAAGAAPSYLFGTMHLGDPRLLALPAPVETAFEGSDRLIIETTDILDQIKMAGALFADPGLTTLADGKTLQDYLTPDQRQKLETMLSAKGVPLQAVERLQPWFLSSGFMLPDCMKEAAGGIPLVLDTDLAAAAKRSGKPVEGLETAAEQLKSLSAIPIEEQVDGLVALLGAEDRLDDVFETMIVLYLSEHIATILPAIEAAVPEGGMLVGSGEGYGSFEEKVITERNVRMADRLEPFLQRGGSFVAVGALHLPGEKGLVSLLEERGFTVTRVKAPVDADGDAAAGTEATPPSANERGGAHDQSSHTNK